jgi:hypothetical protein
LFQISLRNFFKVKSYLYHHYRTQPSEIEGMPFYEYEYLIEDLKEMLDERKAQEERSQSGGDSQPSVSKAMSDMRRMASPSSFGAGMPKFPSIPSGVMKGL